MDSLANGHIVDHKYRILTVLGEGGMGAVYRAQHLLTEQEVALKVLHGGVGQEKLARRFKTEVSIGSRVSHPGIPAVFDAGQEADTGRLYFAMELLEGESLRDRMDNGAPADEVVRWLRDALLVMSAAHAEGVLHRDLKPENLFLERTQDGERLRVLDFGIARDLARPSRTTTGTAVGTAFYMAPEQATGKREITPKVDVWAVGVMLYEALARVLPFDGPSAHAVVVEAVTEAHQPLSEHRPDLGPGWAALIDRCLEKRAELRPSATEASEVLDKLLRDSGNLEPVFELDRRRERETADTAAALEALTEEAGANEVGAEGVASPSGAVSAAPTADAVAIGGGDSALHLEPVDVEDGSKRGWLAAAALLLVTAVGGAAGWAAWPAAQAPAATPAPELVTSVPQPEVVPEPEAEVPASPEPEAETAGPSEAEPRPARPPARRRRVAAAPPPPQAPAGSSAETEPTGTPEPPPTAPQTQPEPEVTPTPEPARPPTARTEPTPPSVIERTFPDRPPSVIRRDFPSARNE